MISSTPLRTILPICLSDISNLSAITSYDMLSISDIFKISRSRDERIHSSINAASVEFETVGICRRKNHFPFPFLNSIFGISAGL